MTGAVQRGFTLLELLVCMAMVAILASLAVPTWREIVARSQRSDGQSALYALATAQERHRLVYGRYAEAAAPAPPVGLGLGLSARGWYELSIDHADATRFNASARPAAGSPRAGDGACRLLTIDESGLRGSAPEGPETCWR